MGGGFNGRGNTSVGWCHNLDANLLNHTGCHYFCNKNKNNNDIKHNNDNDQKLRGALILGANEGWFVAVTL